MALLPQVQSTSRTDFTSQQCLQPAVVAGETGGEWTAPAGSGRSGQPTMTALLLKVVTPPEPFNSQQVSNLLWALAKLVENGRLQMDRGDLVNQAVTALLPQVQSHQDDFTSQSVSNLLWSLAKLVENELLQLDQGGLASQAVTTLLPKVVTPPGPFKLSGHVSNLLWSLAKLVENGLLQLDQGGLASQAVTALLPKVVTPPGPFKPSGNFQPSVGTGSAGRWGQFE